MILKTDAVVLRTLNHGDTSKIVTLYSRESGRLKLIAKGVRSARSKAMGLFQIIHLINVVYYEKQNNELQLFKSGELVEGFYRLETDFDRLTLAQVVVELVERAAERSEPHPQIFDLLVRTLQRLNDLQAPIHKVYWTFHLHFLKELGFRPDTDRCVACNRPLADGARLPANQGELLCLHCEPEMPGDLVLGPELLNLLVQLLDDSWEELPSMQLTGAQRRRIWDFLWQYTHYHIDPTRNMRSLRVLNQLYG